MVASFDKITLVWTDWDVTTKEILDRRCDIRRRCVKASLTFIQLNIRLVPSYWYWCPVRESNVGRVDSGNRTQVPILYVCGRYRLYPTRLFYVSGGHKFMLNTLRRISKYVMVI